jgi:hypothetical protein
VSPGPIPPSRNPLRSGRVGQGTREHPNPRGYASEPRPPPSSGSHGFLGLCSVPSRPVAVVVRHTGPGRLAGIAPALFCVSARRGHSRTGPFPTGTSAVAATPV